MISGKTKVVGLIGDPIGHSLSTYMHNAAFRQLKLDYVYVPFNVKSKNLSEAIKGAKALNIKGLNVTIPHKIKVLNEIDEFDFMANMIGAVNTIKFEDKKSIGYNTDGIGAIKAIEEITELKNKKVIILGAGGAARSIAFQIAVSGIKELVILNRSLKKAESLIYDIQTLLKYHSGDEAEFFKKANPKVKFKFGELHELESHIKDSNILINGTSVGLHPNHKVEPLANADIIHEDLIVNDLVYNPLETELIKEAQKAGAKTISGIKMLVYQGAESFKIWTGIEPPVDLMEKTVFAKI